MSIPYILYYTTKYTYNARVCGETKKSDPRHFLHYPTEGDKSLAILEVKTRMINDEGSGVCMLIQTQSTRLVIFIRFYDKMDRGFETEGGLRKWPGSFYSNQGTREKS